MSQKKNNSSKNTNKVANSEAGNEERHLPLPNLDLQQREYEESLPEGMTPIDMLKQAMDRWVKNGKKSG